MKEEMKFNSQICTSRKQSERLLALGFKPETADMVLVPSSRHDGSDVIRVRKSYLMEEDAIPAWSLHRLIELAMCNVEMNIFISRRCFWINRPHHSPFRSDKRDGVYNGMIDYMQWLIEGGYLNKEYLNDENIH